MMIAIELYIMNTDVDESDPESGETMAVMELCVQKLDAWINGKCFGETDREVVMEAIAIIYGLAAPKGDPATMVCYDDLLVAAESGLLDISEDEAEQAWIDMTEKN